MVKRPIWLLLFGLLTWAAPARAESVLEDYVRMGLEKNLERRARTASVRGVDAAVDEAFGRFLPSVSLDARYTIRSGANIDLGALINPAYAALNELTSSQSFPTDLDIQLPLRQETKLRVTQPIFQPAVWFGYRLSQHRADAEHSSLAAFERDLAADIRAAWFVYAKATKVLEVLERTEPVLVENLRVREALVANDKSTADAVYRAQADLEELRQKKAEAALGRDAARRYFNLLLDRSLAAEVMLEDAPTATKPARQSEEAKRRALAQREELKQLDSGLAAAETGVKLASSAFYPGVVVAADYGFQGDNYRFAADKDFFNVSFVLQWNLFSGFSDSARREQAEYAASRLELERQRVARAIELEVEQRIDDLNVAYRAIETAQARAQSAAQSFHLVERRYEEGQVSSLEYLDARTAFTNAELNQVITTYDYWLRKVELDRALATGPSKG